ncbi:MAG TPA: DoxX family protein [Vicinamibacteria bacterium]|nr:DoxX family protein [Vicinamibacteria bacterium]
MRVDAALLVLRVAGLGLLLLHGIGKMKGLLAGTSQFPASVANLGFPLPTVFAWAAALTEVVGGTLIAIGLFTRVAAAFAAFTMAVAAFGRHKAHLWVLGQAGLYSVSPEQARAWGSPELALAYLLIFVALALAGAGRYAVDARRGGGAGRKRR